MSKASSIREDESLLPSPQGGFPGLLRDFLFFEAERRLKRMPGWLPSAARRMLVPASIRELSVFEGAHQGEDCFILGNGPSLNRTNLGLLSGKHCIGLNKIFLMLQRQPLDLSYLVSVNPFVVEQSLEEFASMGLTTFLPIEYCRKEARVTPGFRGIRVRDRFHFSSTMSGNLGQGHTVTFVALQIAFAMGFERVFLVGVDHRFKQVGEANEIQKLEQPDENHFDPAYFQGQLWHLADLEGSEIAYRIAELEYRRAGRHVFDATVGGKLEVFGKIPFDEAVRMARDRINEPVRPASSVIPR